MTSHIKPVLDVPQARRIVVLGTPGSGKSTLSVSASHFAGDTLPLASPVICSDVLVLQGDSEGSHGPVDCGLQPLVADFTSIETWQAYGKQLVEVLQEVMASETIKYVVVDTALPAKLIVDEAAPKTIADWGKVSAQGLLFYKAFSRLKGKTIIYNCQVKAAVAAVESDAAKLASEAKAVGGERAAFIADLPKGVLSPIVENSSLMLAREVKKVKDLRVKDSVPTREFKTHTSASMRFETKSRFASKLAPTLPGSMTLHHILRLAYGDNL